jgi:hypothetical protein
MAFPLRAAKGSGYRRQRILESPAHAGVGVALRRGMVRSFPDSIFGQGRSTRGTPGLFNHRIC